MLLDSPTTVRSPNNSKATSKKFYRGEGILMNPPDIQKNPVRRTIVKLFLKCLWGKFAHHLQLPKSQYLTEEEELQEKLQDATLEIKGIELLENTEKHPETDMMLINYQEKPNS
jgi:hypothetical protein